jgi:hypothetical protein
VRASALRRRLELLGRARSFRLLFLATLGSDSGSWVAALLVADFLTLVAIGFLLGPLVDRLSLMGSNYALLALGMAAAGPLTDVLGPRCLWGSAAVLSGIAAVFGYNLTRRAAAEAQPPPPPLLKPRRQPREPQPTEPVA